MLLDNDCAKLHLHTSACPPVSTHPCDFKWNMAEIFLFESASRSARKELSMNSQGEAKMGGKCPSIATCTQLVVNTVKTQC